MKKRSYKTGRDVSRLLGLVETLGPARTARLLFDVYASRSGGEIEVEAPGLSQPLRLRRGGTDFHVFLQIFAMGEYDLDMFKQSRPIFARYHELSAANRRPLILDCGANAGFATLWWRRQFPEAEIVAVEPSPDNFAALTANTSHDPAIKRVQAAVWGSKTELRLENPDDGAWAYRFGESAAGTATPTVTIPELIEQEEGSDRLLLVKIDIEGGEKDVFSGDVDWIAQTPLIVIETHDEMQPRAMTGAPFFRAIGGHEFEICFFGENAFVFLEPDARPLAA